MRQEYENQNDRNNEASIINTFCNHIYRTSGKVFKPHKLKKFYVVDYAITRYNNSVCAFAEVKRRKLNHDEIPKIIMSFHKYCELLRLGDNGMKCLLVFGFNDGVFYMDIKSIVKPTITINGRKDRGDQQDIEPVIWIPHNLWIPCHDGI